jgi:HK97 family phage portal protein
MAIVQSLGQLQRSTYTQPPVMLQSSTSTPLGSLGYGQLYRQVPEVRVCVEFIARNIAQLGLHMFELWPDGNGYYDRKRTRTHPAIQLLQSPNPDWTRYRLIESTVLDLCIYHHAFWIKLRKAGGAITQLQPVPPDRMQVAGDLTPEMYRYTSSSGGQWIDLPPTEVIHFRYSDPLDPLRGTSALESLKWVIAESRASSAARIQFWRNGAKLGGVIERPREAGKWSPQARDRFREQFTSKFSGPDNAGSIPVLDEGMQFKPVVATMVDSEATSLWKLTREEVARAYHIPLPMVGILDHATFSNVKEQHRHLYQDCLGPWLSMLTDELELRLLREYDEPERFYLEFNLLDKLAGSFEEQAEAYQSACGRAWMTADEVRSRQNLPHLGGDAARIVMPLNMTVTPNLVQSDEAMQ